jgi:hypothetical protein
LTLTLRLPPSQPGSAANQWSNVARANPLVAGSRISGLLRCRTPDWSSAGVQVPRFGSGAKKAEPVLGLGSSSTSDQSRELNVGEAVVCVATKPAAPDSKS